MDSLVEDVLLAKYERVKRNGNDRNRVRQKLWMTKTGLMQTDFSTPIHFREITPKAPKRVFLTAKF